MATPRWPDWLAEVWAKSPEREGVSGETLAQHTWGVLQRLADLVRLRPHLPTMLHAPDLWQILFWACWLHDFGKAARGFQSGLRGGPRWPHRHEVLSLAFLLWIDQTFTQEDNLWNLWLAAAIAYHHKDFEEISQLYLDIDDLLADMLKQMTDEVDDAVLAGLWQWLSECSASWIDALDLQQYGVRQVVLIPRDAALVAFRQEGARGVRMLLRGLRRWMSTQQSDLPEALKIATLALRGHMVTSDHTASAHTEPLPPSPIHHPEGLLDAWRMSGADLYAHQQACMETAGSAVLIAPTGSGKTEAALLWACSQSGSGAAIPRLFYTLPYQASMNAMYDRLARRCFPEAVGLEHSRSILALYRRFLEDNYDRDQALRLARWTKNLSRLQYFPVRVLSPYQILKAPYKLKGYEALMTDFLGGAFIFDEVHAYEPARLAAILAIVKYLREQFGARFFVMSATLPGLLQARLAEALGSPPVIQATPDLFQEFQRHRLSIKEGDLMQENHLQEIVAESINGASVLVCCNTVGRAQQAYDSLTGFVKDRTDVVLLHGRFNGRDRLAKERLVQDACGSGSTGRRPVLLVSTQVIEVSLDIDLDIIFSDPAPLEALIQRFGRINRSFDRVSRRHRKKEAPVCVFTEPASGLHVYDEQLVRRSLQLLSAHDGEMIDEGSVSSWLDEIYRGEVASAWDEQYRQAYDNFERACLKTLSAFDSSEHLEEMFYRFFDGVEVLPACREEEYAALMGRDEPLEAGQLLVSLSWGQYQKLKKQGLARGGKYNSKYKWLKVVTAPYDSEKGLQLN